MNLIDPAGASGTDTTVDQIANLAVGNAQPDFIGTGEFDDPDGNTALAATYVVPDGYVLKTVDLQVIRERYAARPARKTGIVRVATVDALIAYHAKHATDSAEVWVSRDFTVVDVLNANAAEHAEWSDHRAVLTLQLSPEWQRWSKISGHLLSQTLFAEFLEGAAADVIDPDMATMLEVAQSLTANSKVEFESAYRTKDGQRAFRYKETVNAKAGQRGELEIPERITLLLRVFEGQPAQEVVARFRYRLNGDDLSLGVVIDRIPELLEQARLLVAAEIAERIDRGLVLAGEPD